MAAFVGPHCELWQIDDDFGVDSPCQKPLFSPTAIALGSSAILKVSGQNSFRTLHGSLGQIRLGLPKGSAVGSTKVPPSFSKFRCNSGSLGQTRFGLPKGSAEGSTKVPRKVPPRFHQGSAKVLPRFHQGSTKLLQISWCLWLSGADLSWAAKRFRLGLPKSSAEGSPRFHQGFTEVPPRFHRGSTLRRGA